MTDAIQILERAYDMGVASETEWVKGIAEAVGATLSFSSGAIAYSYQVRDDDWVEIRAICDLGTPAGFAGSLLRIDSSASRIGVLYRTAKLGSVIELLRQTLSPSEFEEYYDRAFAAFGFNDFIFLNACDPSRVGCLVGYPCHLPGPVDWKQTRWSRIAAHVAAGVRLQCKLHPAETSTPDLEGEAILSPDGRVEHATGPAAAQPARERLRAAVLASERARGPLRRRRPDEALEIWRALVAGRWSLVDQFESDGRRFLVAHSNSPTVRDPRSLTEREQQVAAYAAFGHSNKLIAYELGLSPSTVAVLLGRARKKLAGGGVPPIE